MEVLGRGLKDQTFSKSLFHRYFFREFSVRNFILQLLFIAYFVGAKEFRQQSVLLGLVMEKHVADKFIITWAHLICSKTMA